MGFIDSVATNVGTRYALSFGTGDAAAAVERMRITNLGGISFGSTGTAYGTSGEILKSNGNASPTWVAASTVIGGPYLPLAGGTLTGALTGTTATFTGNISALGGSFTDPVTIYDSTISENPRLSVGRNAGEAIQFDVTDRVATIRHKNDSDSNQPHDLDFIIDTPSSGNKIFNFGVAGNTTSTYLTIDSTGATFTGDITSTGLTVDYTGNRTGDAGILVTNDASDWGIKVDKDGTADYGILSQTDGENAIVVRNAAGVNKIQLQGDGDATFAGAGTFTGSLTVTAGAIRLTGANQYYYAATGTNSGLWVEDNFALRFGTNNTQRLIISNTGNATFTATVTAPTFSGDLNGTINTVTTATTKGNSTNDTTVATTAFVQNVIGTIPAGLVFQGTWNASTNSPTLTSGSGTTGNFYIVSVAGSTNLDGITDWQVGDWAVFIEQGASDQWEKIDNSSVLSGSGTGGSIAGWSGSGTSNTLTDAPITFTSAKVEIPRNIEVITSGYPYIDLGVSSSNYFRIIHDNPNDILKIGKNGASTASSVIINPSGDVGIGTASFGHFTNAKELLIEGDAVNTNSVVQVISNDNNSSLAIYSGASSTDDPAIIYQNDLRFGSTTDVGLVGYTERMRINSSGNVLINQTSGVSETKLYVEGSAMPATGDAASVEDMFTLYRYGSATVWSGAASLALGRYSTGGSSFPKSRLDFKLKDASGTNTALPETTVMTMQSNGAVGIGTTNPDAKLEVAGGSTGIILSNLGNASAYDAIRITYTGYNSGTPEFIFQPKTNPGSGTVNSYFRFKSRVSGGSNISNVTVDGKVGIGTLTPGSKLSIDAGVQQDAISINSSDGDGPYAVWRRQNGTIGLVGNANALSLSGNTNFGVRATNDLVFAAGGATERMRIQSDGIISIGEGATQSWINNKVQVTTTAVSGINLTNIDRTAANLIRFTNPQYSTAAQVGLLLKVFPNSDARQGAGLLMTGGSDNSSSNLSLFVSKDDGTSSNISQSYSALHIAGNTGNVGIGQTSLSSTRRLHISGTQAYDTASGGNGTGGIYIKGGTAGDDNYSSGIGFSIGTGTSGISGVQTEGSDVDRMGLAFFTHGSGTGLAASSEAMRIESNGNVGIGTASPSAKLEVAGSGSGVGIKISGDPSAGGAYYYGIMHDGTNLRGTTQTNLLFTEGSVLANTTIATWASLRIAKPSTAATGAVITNNYAIYQESNLQKNYFNGNVGIGTDSPDAKVEISQASSGLQYEALRLTNTADSGNMGAYISWHDSYSVDQMQLISRRDGAGNGSIFTFNQRISGALSPALVLKNGNVGIGTTNPNAKLHVNGSVHFGTDSAVINPTSGQLLLETTAGNSTSLLMYTYGASIFQIQSQGTTAQIGWGSSQPRTVNFTNSGAGSISVGIGTTSPSYELDVAGTIRATGDVIAYSDVRVKENIKTIDNSLEKVSKLRGVEFNKIGDNKKSIGVIAQEIEKVIPEVVKEDDKGMKSVAYGNISGLLIEAIKELKAEIEELKLNKCNCNK